MIWNSSKKFPGKSRKVINVWHLFHRNSSSSKLGKLKVIWKREDSLGLLNFHSFRSSTYKCSYYRFKSLFSGTCLKENNHNPIRVMTSVELFTKLLRFTFSWKKQLIIAKCEKNPLLPCLSEQFFLPRFSTRSRSRCTVYYKCVIESGFFLPIAMRNDLELLYIIMHYLFL